MGKIRVRTLGDEESEKKQQADAKVRREAKKAQKEKAHVTGVGLKGGQQIKVMEGVQLTAEAQAAVNEMEVGDGAKKVEKKARKVRVMVRSKRYQQAVSLFDKNQSYDIKKAIELVKSTSTTAFDGTVEAHVNINAATLTKEKKSLSGSVNLPHGTGKKRIIVIADEALIEQVQKGKIEFDILVAHPSMMPKLARVARILGPKGLMPNPKNGTVTPTPEKRVTELAGGEINWKTEPDQPVIHQAIGKVSFTPQQLEDNLRSFVKAIGSGKIAKLTLSSSMGPGIKVTVNSI